MEMETGTRAMAGLDMALAGWLALALLSTMYVASRAITAPGLVVTRCAWVLATVYTGPIGALLYTLSHGRRRAAAPDTSAEPTWEQALTSSVHCVAGDATGIIAVAAFGGAFSLPMWLDLLLEYVLGFGFGLFVFQALSMKGTPGGSYASAVRRSLVPSWLSMNAMMAGMTPTMVIWMTRDTAAMQPGSTRFWAVMSLATLVGAVATYPLNWWLAAAGATHQAHDDVAPATRGAHLAWMSLVSLLALAAGVLLAAACGDLGMHASSR